MIKLNQKGVNIFLFLKLFILYEYKHSCLRTQRFTSDWFPVNQGTRQGGSLIPYLYIVFDNNLLAELKKCAYCFMMYRLQCGFP